MVAQNLEWLSRRHQKVTKRFARQYHMERRSLVAYDALRDAAHVQPSQSRAASHVESETLTISTNLLHVYQGSRRQFFLKRFSKPDSSSTRLLNLRYRSEKIGLGSAIQGAGSEASELSEKCFSINRS